MSPPDDSLQDGFIPISRLGGLFFCKVALEKLFCYNRITSGRLEIASMLVLKGLRAVAYSLVEFSRRVLNYDVFLKAKPYVKIRHRQLV